MFFLLKFEYYEENIVFSEFTFVLQIMNSNNRKKSNNLNNTMIRRKIINHVRGSEPQYADINNLTTRLDQILDNLD